MCSVPRQHASVAAAEATVWILGAGIAPFVNVRPYIPRNVRRLRRLLEGTPVGMLTTQTYGGESHSRPMLVHDVDANGWLWLITDCHSRKACELSRNPRVMLAFQAKNGARYVSVEGTGVVVRDDVKLRELWNPTLRSWFPRGRRDAEIVLVAVRVARRILARAAHAPPACHWYGESPPDGQAERAGKARHFGSALLAGLKA